METKWFLLARWSFVLGFLGAMGVCTNAIAQTASYAAPQIDAPTLDKNEASDESTASDESLSKWTRSDCYNAWHYNMQGCNTAPPNFRPVCWAAASSLLAACLAAAQ